MLVRGAIGSARAFGISPLMIGLTLVGFGTSMPELVTSLIAAFEEAPGITVGNVVGSNIANILLILGITALIAPLAVAPQAFRRDSSALALATFACVLAVLHGQVDHWIGIVFVSMLAGYIVWAYLGEKNSGDAQAQWHEQAAERPAGHGGLVMSLTLTAIGIVVTVVGAKLLVDGAIALASEAGMSQTVIGLTVVAVGTSLPELVACVVAALRGHADVAIGNIIGSGIYNVLGILGVTAAVHPIMVPDEVARLDVWVMAGATLLLLAFLRTGWRLRRWEGGVFALLYALYAGYLVASA